MLMRFKIMKMKSYKEQIQTGSGKSSIVHRLSSSPKHLLCLSCITCRVLALVVCALVHLRFIHLIIAIHATNTTTNCVLYPSLPVVLIFP